jgi:predicted RNA binding protein YcfA (HicA-like mRNA interferase family)
MSKHEKLLKRIEERKEISFSEAQNLLIGLGYSEKSRGSHHSFRKAGRETITIKKQDPINKEAVKDLKQALQEGYF